MDAKQASQILAALDGLALSLPDGFIWPDALKKAYTRACRLLKRMGAE